MLRSLIACGGSLALVLCGTSHFAVASPGQQSAQEELPPESGNGGGGNSATTTTPFGTSDDGTIGAGVDTGPSGGGAAPGPATYRPTCRWVPANITNTAGTGAVGDTDDGGSQIENDNGDLGWLRVCGDGEPEFVWLPPAVDPIDLVPGASARARAQLPLPEPNMSPAPEIGSVVNLGLWFAVEDPGVTTARATLGNAWAQVRGSFASVSIDPGDGSDHVTCDGFGTPYPAGAEDPGEGPCGHTYLQRTRDDQPHQMTYTITYALTWSTSDGRSGSLGAFDRSVTFDYDIDEIQIVGTG